jgi:hypothetical protein
MDDLDGRAALVRIFALGFIKPPLREYRQETWPQSLVYEGESLTFVMALADSLATWPPRSTRIDLREDPPASDHFYDLLEPLPVVHPHDHRLFPPVPDKHLARTQL